MFWIAEEIDFETDKKDWENKLQDDEKRVIMFVLGFFSFADGIINENILTNFMNQI